MLTDDRELERLNRMFLGRNTRPTCCHFPRGEIRLGDIAISVQRAREKATEQGHSTYDEIRILMLHGLLHLLGMNHENDGERWRGRRRNGVAIWYSCRPHRTSEQGKKQ